MKTNGRTHGKATTYQSGCRCDDCRTANAVTVREQRSRRVPPSADDPRHGTESLYKNHNCRCDLCRISANAADLERKTRNRPPAELRPAQAFFVEHVSDQTDDCILWPFSKNQHGYGMFSWGGVRTTSHAAACEVWHGPRPDGMETNHLCENRACFNGRHLRWGTHRENIDTRERLRSVRLLAAIVLATVAMLGLSVGAASAHTPSVVASCSGLAVNLQQYEAGQNGTNNRVTTTIDGTPTVANFGGSYTHVSGWSQTANHTWSVVIDANRQSGNATQYDKSFSGTWQACQVAPTTTAATTTTVAQTTTTVAATTTTQPAVTTTVAVMDPTTTVVEIFTPPVPCVYNVTLPADSPLCVPPAQPPAEITSGLGIDTPRSLPATGSSDELIWLIASVLTALGVGALLISRRRA